MKYIISIDVDDNEYMEYTNIYDEKLDEVMENMEKQFQQDGLEVSAKEEVELYRYVNTITISKAEAISNENTRPETQAAE